MDYYSILGVPKNASEQDIRKAYKKQSMQHHPDRGGDEEKFKQVNEAYQTLKDPQKRAAYDSPSFNNNNSYHQWNFNSGNMNDIFEQMFRETAQRRAQRRNKDIQLVYNINFEEIFESKEVDINYTLPSGLTESLRIRIPAGIESGETIRIADYGDNSFPNLPRGSLLVKLQITAVPKDWVRHKCDLATKVKVSIFDLLLGTTVFITTPEGKNISINVPKGSQSGTTFSVQGYGIPDRRTGRRGKILVQVDGKVPKITNEAILKQIENIKKNIAN